MTVQPKELPICEKENQNPLTIRRKSAGFSSRRRRKFKSLGSRRGDRQNRPLRFQRRASLLYRKLQSRLKTIAQSSSPEFFAIEALPNESESLALSVKNTKENLQ